MKNNKLICIVLALLVCLTMAVSASADNENDLTFAVESPDSTVEIIEGAVVKAGEEITVAISIKENTGIKAAIAYVEFDSKVLEFVKSDNAIDELAVKALSDGKLSLTFGDPYIFDHSKQETISTTGTVVELTFKALAETDVDTAVSVTIKRANVVQADGSFKAEVAGGELNVHVVAKDHVCNAENVIVSENTKVEPTCTTAGKEADKYCAHCGALVAEGAEIAALGHGETEIRNASEATCAVDGYTGDTYCTVCGDKIADGEVIPATGDHAWNDGEITTESTCKDFGVRTYICTVCGATKTDEYTVKAEHTYGEWVVTKEATSAEEGEQTRTCSVCGEKETQSIEKLPEEKDNTVLIVVIVVVVVLAGAGVAAYFVLKNKKKQN